MNKASLIDALVAKTGLDQSDVRRLVEAYIETTTECLARKEELTLARFGTLKPIAQNPRPARNPKTGTPVMIPARTSVKFKPSQFLIQAMNPHE